MRFDQLVILHGWGSDLSRWRPLAKNLQARVLPLPTDKVRNTAAYSDWLYEKTKPLPPFVLIGHSFGGQIAINFAARHPERVAKLILIASAGVRRRNLKALILRPLAKIFKFLPTAFKRCCYRLIGETDYLKANPIMKETMKLILKEDQQENMAKIKTPTLIIWGEADRYTPLKDGRLTHELIRNSRLEILPGGHGLPFSHTCVLTKKILWFIK